MTSRLSMEVCHHDSPETHGYVINETLIRYSPFTYNGIESRRTRHDVQLHRVHIQYLILTRELAQT